MGEVIMGVDFKGHKTNATFRQAYDAVRRDLAELIPFALSGGPIIDHNDYACSEMNPDGAA
jgi:hypothetical protein